jgi:hypothetical protein
MNQNSTFDEHIFDEILKEAFEKLEELFLEFKNSPSFVACVLLLELQNEKEFEPYSVGLKEGEFNYQQLQFYKFPLYLS